MPSPRPAFGVDASRFPDADSLARQPRCAWHDCESFQILELPVCRVHALAIHKHVKDALTMPSEPTPRPERPAYVYYLIIGPSTVKIGVTTCLIQRLNALRSELQYVVAIERGGRELERARHKEFAVERIRRREDFRLSERLKQHIEALQPQRDELIELAASPGG